MKHRFCDPGLVKFLESFNIDLVIDVGANRGQFARNLFADGYRGEILSFEPLLNEHAELMKASNGDSRWHVAERVAIGNTTGASQINIAGNSLSSSVLPMLARHSDAAPASEYIGTESVPICRLDDCAHSVLAHSVCPFLKLDVQGYEREAIRGASALMKKIVGLQVELSVVPLYCGGALIEEILAELRSDGFVLFKICPGFTDHHSNQVLQYDGIFFRENSEDVGLV